MTRREYYDLLVRTSLEGGFPSVDLTQIGPGNNGCSYRTPDGKRCAVGVLIPDWRYGPGMEGKLAGDLINEFSLEDIIPDGMDVGQLHQVQNVHDTLAYEVDDTTNRYVPRKWDHGRFVADLNELHFFREFAL
jgi:hypothetical protein